MLALVLVLLSQVTPDSRVSRVERVPGGRMEGGRGGVKGWAFFEAFPVGGAGTSGACSTTAPTGAKGEVLTFSRTGNATCTKTATGGLATTGIANGDLVVMSANQPRVEYDSAGVLGLLVESARTNSLLRSEALDNAAWTWENSGAAATTRTADYAVAPDGTTTAERLEIPATSGAQYSDVYQSFTVAAASGFACSIFMRGTSASGTTDLCGYDGAAWSCSDCTFTSDSWARCSKSWASGTGTSRFCKLGNNSNQNGGVARAAVDVLAAGFQGEAGAYATSYIPTTSAAVTRNAETATVDLGAAVTLQANNMSMALTSVLEGNASGIAGVMNVNAGSAGATSGTDSMWAYFSSPGSLRCLATTGSATGIVAVALTSARTWCAATPSTVSGSHNGVAMASSGAPLSPGQPARFVNIGASPFPYGYDGIYSRVCVDPSPTRCR